MQTKQRHTQTSTKEAHLAKHGAQARNLLGLSQGHLGAEHAQVGRQLLAADLLRGAQLVGIDGACSLLVGWFVGWLVSWLGSWLV